MQKVRGQFASWAAVSLGCMGINVATGIQDPWFLFPTFGMGIGLLRNYATLWQTGYSWRDVLRRPPAPQSVEATLARGGQPVDLPLPAADDYGAHLGPVLQAHGDRTAILKLVEKLPPSERQMLPEIQGTVDGLYARATDLALGTRVALTNDHDVNLVITNVPGPQFPMFAAGAEMVETYPVPPLLPGFSLAIGVTSYDGSVYYGLNADRDALPDVDVIGQCISEALDEMVDSASDTRPRAPRGRRRPHP